MELVTKWINVSPSLPSKFLVEFFATMFFHFLGSLSATPWGNGIVLIGLVYYTAKISNAHINPAITLAFSILGYHNPIEVIVYWIAQVSGAIVGALWLALLVPNLNIRDDITTQLYSGCFTSTIPHWSIFGFELIGTLSFLLPIYAMLWLTTHKDGFGGSGALIVGISLVGNALAIAPFTGAAFNPARVIASPVVFDCNNSNYMGYYIFGELVGAILVCLFIMPWYGVPIDAWYFHMLPEKGQNVLKKVSVQPKRNYV